MAPASSVLSPKQKTPARNTSESATANSGYFGLALDGGENGSSGARVVFGNGSNSSIRSAAASPPQSLPFHSASNLDAFRQATSRGSFNLNQSSVPKNTTSSQHTKERPTMGRRKSSKQEPSTPTAQHTSFASEKADSVPPADPTASSRSPNKRLLSSDSSAIPGRSKHDVLPSFSEAEEARASGSPRSKTEGKHPRLAENDQHHKVFHPPSFRKADTMPESFEMENPVMVSAQYLVNVIESGSDQLLILDLRGSSQYAQSHVVGALNLCVPTTLLKRPTYHVSRLADTFKDDAQRTKFEQWKTCKSILVYDSNSTQLSEAACCVNVLKKFVSEDWRGRSYILRGGFFEFSRKFPKHLELGSDDEKQNFTLKSDDDVMAPVIGGCAIPASASKTAANPFFGNIRQNMDLIGGVGQIQISVPPTANKRDLSELPQWLRRAADEDDEGKAVSEKFLSIEKREQQRMQEALSGEVVYGAPDQESPYKIQIAGIEKGNKNRYNNIWPFEHTRVKLQGVPSHGCDYVNANFIKSSLSNKKFIATQGPIPATFNDFWNMVWQRNVRVIVMLTAEIEGGQVKAHNYWNQKSYGQLNLRYLSERRASLEPARVRRHRTKGGLSNRGLYSLSEAPSSKSESQSGHGSTANDLAEKSKKSQQLSSDEPYVLVRKFTLSHGGEPFEKIREITHLQYSGWPDFGTPAHPAHLLGLVEQCDAVVTADRSTSQMSVAQPDERPVLVHCSAGCGRTGTFCTVDTVIDVLKKQKNFERNRPALGGKQGKGHAKSTIPQLDVMDIDKDTGARCSPKNPSLGAADDGISNTKLDWLARDDIDFVEKTVEEFRLQRLSMVQSLRQFVLCYEAVLEWVAVQSMEES